MLKLRQRSRGVYRAEGGRVRVRDVFWERGNEKREREKQKEKMKERVMVRVREGGAGDETGQGRVKED